MVLWQLSGLVLSAAGLFALHRAWQAKQRHWGLIGLGWALLLGSVLVWGRTSGVDKGPALGLISITIMAMLAIFVAAMRTPVKQRRQARVRNGMADTQTRVRHSAAANVASILAIVIFGLAASVAACTALFMGNRALGMEHTANLSLTMFAFPLAWAGLATYIGYSSSIRTRATVLTGVLALSSVIIFSSMQVT
ncbi:hypothetical protein [Blastomonas sp.]|uniref:hypothetical protein n=1 Tax=Blastomonas sp. TaxID=1909299 RepID=UPI002638D484|nr:hypothetical protein [Blastomonas sp.]MDM7957461.1 hypothetical protein [Blastomonas sp.]